MADDYDPECYPVALKTIMRLQERRNGLEREYKADVLLAGSIELREEKAYIDALNDEITTRIRNFEARFKVDWGPEVYG